MRWLLLVLFYVFIEFYAFQAFRSLSKSRLVLYIYLSISLALLLGVIYDQVWVTDPVYKRPGRLILYGVVLTITITKIILSLGMLLEDGFRVGTAIIRKISNTPTQDTFMPSRRKFVATMAIGLAALPFSTMIYGMIRGRYNFKVLKYELEFEDLPEAFDGYTLTQISDVHVGSWDNEEKFTYAMELINEQKSDVILFTGDLVNNIADELTRWKGALSKLKAKDGVFSVLGNHDYGDYHQWASEEDKKQNLEVIKRLQQEMGWQLLNNEHVWLKKDAQRIALVGVENWGNGNFKKAGDLQKASDGVAASAFKILMSHDPSHWEYHVKDAPEKYHLTLSGHTHGMQYGIDIPGFIRWSPSQYRYKHWAGLYQEKERYLYVNRGLGFLGYPGRFGVWPEVTVIRLKKKSLS